MDKITLSTKDVSMVFPGVKALSNVNFEISTGEIHAIVGANGAGKSTLMNVFAGSNPGYTGQLFLNGEPIHVNDKDVSHGLYCIEGQGNDFGHFKMKKFNFRGYRDFHCSAVNFTFVACGRLSAISFIWDSYWDYVPGMFIIEKAGGVIYNEPYLHIAANSQEFLEVLKENSHPKDGEELDIIKKHLN